MAQQVDHLARRDLLGIEQVVDTHVDEQLLVVRFEVLVVVDAGDGLLRPEPLGQRRRHDIVRLLVIDGDEKVAPAHRSAPQHREGRRVALDGEHVGQTAHLGQQFLVGVDNGDIVAVAAQHPGQMAAHLAGSRNYDLHGPWFAAGASPRRTPGHRANAERETTAAFLQFNSQIYTFVPETANRGKIKKRNVCPPG